MDETIRIPIGCDEDIVKARQRGRELAASLGFTSVDRTFIATAISELARNIVTYAREGAIELQAARNGTGLVGIVVTARDQGPGIPDVEKAMSVGYSTGGHLGIGLPGVRRLMDELKVDSTIGRGTVVVARKWRR